MELESLESYNKFAKNNPDIVNKVKKGEEGNLKKSRKNKTKDNSSELEEEK